MALAFEAKEDLQNLGVFSEVDLLIDTSSGNSGKYQSVFSLHHCSVVPVPVVDNVETKISPI